VSTPGGRKPNQIWMFNANVINQHINAETVPINMRLESPIHPAYQAGEDLMMHMVLFQRGVRVVKLNTIRHRKISGTGGGTCGRVHKGTIEKILKEPIERYIDYYRCVQPCLLTGISRNLKSREVSKPSHLIPFQTFDKNNRVISLLGRYYTDVGEYRTTHEANIHKITVQDKGSSIIRTFVFPDHIKVIANRSAFPTQTMSSLQKIDHPYGIRWVTTMVLLEAIYGPNV
jgi:hypothetical protein